MPTKTLYPLGETPETGVIPQKMLAQVIRSERFGKPTDAFKIEEIDVPSDLRPDEVLVWVMAAGVNYNNVWAALGEPINVIKGRDKDNYFPDSSGFHIGGSDASGIVWKVGSAVTNVKVGDEVVLHCGQWSLQDPLVKAGKDPMFGQSFKIWGYETSWGSFAQFTKAQAQQCLPKPKHLSWAAASSYMLVGATAFRMLRGWEPNIVREGDVVLVWGGSGGLGTQAIQIARAYGATPVAVVSRKAAGKYCVELGAKGYVNRSEFTHWGLPPDWRDQEQYGAWLKEARRFGKAIWAITDGKSPQIVFEHPGESTVPTSVLVCETGGMVVICAGTSGYAAQADLRYLWMRQKRLQGSHFANDKQAAEYNQLVIQKKVDPCHSETFSFEDIPRAHQLMYENKHKPGNMSCLVNARE